MYGTVSKSPHLRIAQVSTLGSPVRREHAGSIEQHVWLLTRELVALGHQVTVFATAESEVDGELRAVLPGPYHRSGSPGDWRLCELLALAGAVRESARFDIIHAHNYLWSIPLEDLSASPMVHTLHVQPGGDESTLRKIFPAAFVTGLSEAQWAAYPAQPADAIVHHGIDSDQFPYVKRPDDYLVFLGRFIAGKGPLEAIGIAAELNLPIILAGPQNEYFDRHLAPLVDGERVRYTGYLKGEDRAALLGNARALLAPFREPEPFGLVMAEAATCGTPVVTIRVGAAPEVIDHGKTGAVAESLADLPEAARMALSLDRAKVRRHALSRFSPTRMASEYVAAYRNRLNRREAAA